VLLEGHSRVSLVKIDRRHLRSKGLSLIRDFLERVNTNWLRNRHGSRLEKLEMSIRNSYWKSEEKKCMKRTDSIVLFIISIFDYIRNHNDI